MLTGIPVNMKNIHQRVTEILPFDFPKFSNFITLELPTCDCGKMKIKCLIHIRHVDHSRQRTKHITCWQKKLHFPADLTVSKRPGTIHRIEIHFGVFNHLYLLFSFMKLVETL